jgi:hypothetical protein
MTTLNKALVVLGGIALVTTLVLPQRQTVQVLNQLRRLTVDSFGTVMGTRTGNAAV